MFVKPRKRKGFASMLGLALVAMLAFGAFGAGAAQASPQWHIDGETLAERGVEKAGVTTDGGKITVEMQNGLTVECVESWGTGEIVGKSGGSLHLNAKKCNAEKSKWCTVQPFAVDLLFGLTTGGKTGVIVTLSPNYAKGLPTIDIDGELCWAAEELELFATGGSLGAEVGPEGVGLPITGLTANTIKATVNGSMAADISFSGAAKMYPYDVELPLGAW